MQAGACQLKMLRRLNFTGGQARGLASSAMARVDINSRYKMLSGYEIPILGFGVSQTFNLLSCFSSAANRVMDYKPEYLHG